MTRLIIFILFVLALDFYALQSLRSVSKNFLFSAAYVLISLIVLVYFLYQIITLDRTTGINPKFYNAFALFVLIYVPKFVLIVFMFGEDLFRLFEGIFNAISSKTTSPSGYFSSRRRFIGQLALGLASVPFLSILYGITKGKYNYKVLKYTLYFDDLPSNFDGYQLTQISDIHSGSFDNKAKVDYAVDLINQQQSNVIFFTGDLVNNKASEMNPWKSTFSKLKAKDGIFSVLGNHDYGDYMRWPTKEAKTQNFQDLKDLQREMGFELLLNDSKYIKKGDQKIAVVGVENWGKGFKQKGDLSLATANINPNDFKILLSHDPSHWQYKVKDSPLQYHLTLSGHTHGMQFGIEIPGLVKWSPVQWRYKYWAGIYENSGRFLNVNRGFGYLAFPGRVGIWPEITVITLRRGKN